MSQDKLKYLSVDIKKEKIVLTTRDITAGTKDWERWIYRPTLPVFDIKLSELTKDIISGHLLPLPSCNHRELFRMLDEALHSLSLVLYGYNELYTKINEKNFVYFVAKTITIPYFHKQEIDMDEIKTYIKEVLSPQYAETYMKTVTAVTTREGKPDISSFVA